MPLLYKQPFVNEPVPPGLQLSDTVFHCKVTGEIFTDYEKFFDRVILCNSLVWSCELTGRSGLTYQEAVDSERHARKRLAEFPTILKIPILLLMTLTRRRRLADARDDVFGFLKDRFFVGEEVMVSFAAGNKKSCSIEKVMSSNGYIKPQNGTTADNSSDNDSDVICLDDDPPATSSKQPVPAAAICTTGGTSSSDPLHFEYLVRSGIDRHVVSAQAITRTVNAVSRERCLLFLRNHCFQDVDGIWKVKESVLTKNKLSSLNLSMYFAGPGPEFPSGENSKSHLPKSAVKAGPGHSNVTATTSSSSSVTASAAVIDLTEDEEMSKQYHINRPVDMANGPKMPMPPYAGCSNSTVAMRESIADREAANWQHFEMQLQQQQLHKQQLHLYQEQYIMFQKQFEREIEMKRQQRLDEELRFAQREAWRKQYFEEKQKRKEQIAEEKMKRKLEIERQKQHVKEWNRPREDMECDDLKELPVSTPIECVDPSNIFAEVVFVLEYLQCFKSLLSFELPENLTVETFGKALMKSELDGMFIDILRQLLTAVLQLQEEELPSEILVEELNGCVDDLEDDAFMKIATDALQFPVLTYGKPLQQMQLDSLTVTEILRLHLLSSGAKRLPSVVKSDFQQRGGYTFTDDPGSEFCRSEANIIKTLSKQCVSELNIGDKLKVLAVLIHQLLTFSTCRDFIDESFDQFKATQRDLKNHQSMDQRRLRDEAQFWAKKRLEERTKQAGVTQEGTAITAEEHASLPNGTPGDKTTVATNSLHRFSRKLKEKDFENFPADNIDWESLGSENRDLLSQWTKRKEKELIDQITEHQRAVSICPIGRDRNFRRYWVFRCVPGLFVEPSEEYLPETCHTNVSDSNLDNKAADNSVDCAENTGFQHTNNSASNSRTWSVYHTTDQLEQLISSLNARGLREGPLRAALLEQSQQLRDWLGQCNISVLTGSWSQERDKSVSSSSAEQNLGCILREMILDFEERIYTGSIGALKVKSREAWRSSLQSDGGETQAKCKKASKTRASKRSSKVHDMTSESGDVPSVETQSNDSESADESTVSSAVAADLSRALLQVEQMVEARCRKAPLESDSKTLAQWKSSLTKQPSSLSRVALYLSALETSIIWSRSANNARCRICWRRGNADVMLLCDGCDRGHHTFCLKPPMKNIPSGKWFCPTCQRDQVKKVTDSKQKIRKKTVDPDISGEHEDSSSDELQKDSDDESNGSAASADSSESELNSSQSADEVEIKRPARRGATASAAASAAQPQPQLASRASSLSSSNPQQRILRSRISDVVDRNGSQSPADSRSSTPVSLSSSKPLRVRVKLAGASSTAKLVSDNCDTTTTVDKVDVQRKRKSTGQLDVECKKRTKPSSNEKNQPSIKLCEDLVEELTQRDEAWPFQRPVVKREAPGYYDIVRHPMDFSTIKTKLSKQSYSSAHQILEDIRLIFSNCSLYYNSPTSPERQAGHKLTRHFEKRLRELQLSMVASAAESKGSKQTRSSAGPVQKIATRSRRTL